MDQEQICYGSDRSVLPSLSANHPWFVTQNLDAEDETEVQIFYTLHGPTSHYRCRIPELLGKHIRGCFHGWVLLSSHPDNVKWSLWNPITSKSIRLPPLVYEGDIDKIKYCCLSAPPDDPNSVLLLARFKRPNIVFCRLHRKAKKSRWTEMTYAKKLRSVTGLDGLLRCLTYCRGKVYAMASLDTMDAPCRLIQVDILVKDREIVINLLPILKIPCPSFGDCEAMLGTLKGSSTELFIIAVGFKDEARKNIGAVHLYKLDMLSMKWNEVEDLEDTVFSVESEWIVSYSPAIASEFAGYIHICCEKGKIIYSYNVKDKTIALSSMPCLVRTSYFSAWEMLECSRLEGDDADLKQEEGKDDEIVVRSVKNDDVELKDDRIESNSTTNTADQLNTQSRILEMSREFCVGRKCLYSVVSCFGYESRLEDEVAVTSANGAEVTNESHLLNIPSHVLETIMEFCVGVEFLNFRATCKRCHLAAPLIQWSSKKALERFQNYSLASPWLMVFDRLQGIITFKDPIFGDNYFMKMPQELVCEDYFKIHCSRDGWLLILTQYIYGNKLVFFNPFTSDIRTLPPVRYLDSYCFSAPPTSPDCMVVGLLASHVDTEWTIFIHFVAREPSWRTFALNISKVDQGSFPIPTFYGRDLYALCKDGVVGVLRDIGAEDHSWEAVAGESPTSVCRSLARHFLVKCDQHLLLVVVSEFGESVEVFKPTDDLEWEKIDSLGRHTFFICDTTCLCVETKTPEMENKIYFPRMHSGNEKIVFYSLETCRYHTYNGKNIEEEFDDFFGTKNHISSHVWIVPTWS